MRTDSCSSGNNLHWHDGATCHGCPTLVECAEDSICNGYIGKILEQIDVRGDGVEVRCYSMIVSSFAHWSKRGKFVAEVKLVVQPIT